MMSFTYCIPKKTKLNGYRSSSKKSLKETKLDLAENVESRFPDFVEAIVTALTVCFLKLPSAIFFECRLDKGGLDEVYVRLLLCIQGKPNQN